MNDNRNCDQVRLNLMAAFDDEAEAGADASLYARQHLESCAACTEWLRALQAMDGRLHQASYPSAHTNVWPAVERALRPVEAAHASLRRLYAIAAIVIGWRALQLLIDLPLPFLGLLVPLVAGLAALWQLARDPLAIQTFAPELQKRGV